MVIVIMNMEQTLQKEIEEWLDKEKKKLSKDHEIEYKKEPTVQELRKLLFEN